MIPAGSGVLASRGALLTLRQRCCRSESSLGVFRPPPQLLLVWMGLHSSTLHPSSFVLRDSLNPSDVGAAGEESGASPSARPRPCLQMPSRLPVSHLVLERPPRHPEAGRLGPTVLGHLAPGRQGLDGHAYTAGKNTMLKRPQ